MPAQTLLDQETDYVSSSFTPDSETLGDVRKYVTDVDDWSHDTNEGYRKTQFMRYLLGGYAERTGNGGVMSVLDGEAGRQFTRVTNERYERFLSLPGAQALSPTAKKRVLAGIALDEAVARAPLGDLQEFHKSLDVTYNTLAKAVGEQVQASLESGSANDPAVMGVARRRQKALLYLNQIPKAMRLAAVQELMGETAANAWPNSVEQHWYDNGMTVRTIIQQKGNKSAKAHSQFHTAVEVMKDLFGPEDMPNEILQNLMRQVKQQRALKNLGIIDGDPLKEGILIEDAQGVMSPLLFQDQKTLTEVVDHLMEKPRDSISQVLQLRKNYGLLRDEAEALVANKYRTQALNAVAVGLSQITPDVNEPEAPEAEASMQDGLILGWDVPQMNTEVRAAMRTFRQFGETLKYIQTKYDKWDSYPGLKRALLGYKNQPASVSPGGWLAPPATVDGRPVPVPTTREERMVYEAARGPFEALGMFIQHGFIRGEDDDIADLINAGKANGKTDEMIAQDIKKRTGLRFHFENSLAQGGIQMHEERMARINRAVNAGEWYGFGAFADDVIKSTIFATGTGLASQAIGVMESPETLPLVYFGEKLFDPLVMRPFEKLDGALKTAAKMSKLNNLIRLGMDRHPAFMNGLVTRLEGAVAGLKAGTVEHSQFKAQLGSLVDRARALLNLHEQHGLDVRTLPGWGKQVNQFAREFGKAYKPLTDVLDIGKDITDWIETPDRGTFGWKIARDQLAVWRGKVPGKMNLEISKGLALLNRQWAPEALAKIANWSPEFERLSKAQSALAKLQANEASTPAQISKAKQEVDELMQSMGDRDSPAHKTFRELVELDNLSNRLRKARSPGEIESLTVDIQRKATSLMGRKPLDNIDVVTLQHINDLARRPDKTFWDRLGGLFNLEGVGGKLRKAARLSETVTAVERVTGFVTRQLVDHTAIRAREALRKMRLDHVYHFVRSKIENELDELAMVKEGGGKIDVDYEAALKERANVILQEHRRAVGHQPHADWKFEGKVANEHLTNDDLLGLIEDLPELWEGAIDDSLFQQAKIDPNDPVIKNLTERQDMLSTHIDKYVRTYGEEIRHMLWDVPEHIAGYENLIKTFGEDEGAALLDLMARTQGLVIQHLRTVAHGREVGGAQSQWTASLVDAQEYKRAAVESFKNLVAHDPDFVGANRQTAKILAEVLAALPDSFYERGLRFSPTRLTDPNAVGMYTPGQQLIHLRSAIDADDVDTFWHEIGHFVLEGFADEKTLAELTKIFNTLPERIETKSAFYDSYAGNRLEGVSHELQEQRRNIDRVLKEKDPHKVFMALDFLMHDPGPYWSRFTEWFARSFADHMLDKTGKYSKTFDPMADGFRHLLKTVKDKVKEPNFEFLGPMIDDLMSGKRKPISGRIEMATTEKNRAWGLRNDPAWMLRADLERRGVGNVDQLLKDRRWAQFMLFREYQTLPTEELRTIAGALAKEREALLAFMQQVATKKDVNAYRSLVSEHRKVNQTLQDVLEARPRVATEEGMRALKDTLELNSEKRATMDSLQDIRELQGTLAAGDILQYPQDVLTLGALPYWDQVRATRAIASAAEHNAALYADRMQRLSLALGTMTTAERNLLKKAMKDPSLLSPVQVERLREQGLDFVVTLDRRTPYQQVLAENFKGYLKQEGEIQASLLEKGHEIGLIDDADYINMRRSGYSPHLYGMYERPQLVKSAKMQKARAAMRGTVSGTTRNNVTGIDGTELMLARDLNNWRVRVEEGDGVLTDKLFPTKSGAMEFIRKTWGDEALRTLEGDGAVQRVVTSHGDEIALAKPIGEDGLALDLLTAKHHWVEQGDGLPPKIVWEEEINADARLENFARLNRDVHAHAMLKLLKESGFVKSPLQLLRSGAEAAKGGQLGAVIGEWRALPDNRRVFGNLSGQYIHQAALRELNGLHHSYDQLRSWMSSLEDLYSRTGVSPLEEMATKSLRKLTNFDEKVSRMVKTTQILLNQAAYVANMGGNVVFSILCSGTRALNPKNLPFMLQAAADVFGATMDDVARYFSGPRKKFIENLGVKMRGNSSQYMDEALRHGLINSALFERSSDPRLRKAFLNLAHMMDDGVLKERLGKLEEMLHAKLERKQSGLHTRDIELEIAAIEEALATSSRSYVKRMVDWLGGLGFKPRDALGMSTNPSVDLLRDLYGKIDDFWKLLNYSVLRQDMGEVAAATRVKLYMQDYANVPQAVQSLSKSPFGALVPSFGWEMFRIFKNAAANQPLRLMGTLGAISAWNTFGAAAAGISDDRMEALHQAMGNRDSLEQMFANVTNLRFYDPFQKTVVMNIDIANTLIPLLQFTDSHSALARLADKVWTPEERTGLQSALSVALKTSGNFFLGKPALSWAAALGTGVDPMTGKPLVGERARATDYLKAGWHVIGKSLIPPSAPGGRQWADFQEAVDTPLDPFTGRPLNGRSAGRTLIRSLTNISIRGGLSSELSRVLGQPERFVGVNDTDIIKYVLWNTRDKTKAFGTMESPLYGEEVDERNLWARLMSQTADPEEKKKYRQELVKMLDQPVRITSSGIVAERARSDYELARAMDSMEKRGVYSTFDKFDPFYQANALTGMLHAGVDRKRVAEFVDVMRTAEGTRRKLEGATNPTLLKDTRAWLEKWIDEHPDDAEVLQPAVNWINWNMGRARREENLQRNRGMNYDRLLGR